MHHQPGILRAGRSNAAAVWSMIMLGGVMIVAFASRSSTLRDLWRRVMGCGPAARSSAPRLRSFQLAIVGTDKQTIAAALGPPPATVGFGTFLSVGTWYYPLDPRKHTALVIEFDDRDVACATAVLRSPRM